MKNKFKAALELNPTKTRCVDKKRYFALEVTVRANRHANDFGNGTLTFLDKQQFCAKTEGSAVLFDYKRYDINNSGLIVDDSFAILYSDFLSGKLECSCVYRLEQGYRERDERQSRV